MQKPALGRVVHVLVNPAINNGSDVAPATITRVWPTPGLVNLRVMLDGPSGPSDWATSRKVHADEETARAQLDGALPSAVSVHAFWPAKV